MTSLKRFGMLLLSSFVYTVSLWAQAASNDLKINVSSKEGGNPLSAVYIQAGKNHYISDVNGNCNLPGTLNPLDSVIVRCLGYEVFQTTIQQIRYTQPFRIQLHLKENNLDEILITAQRKSFSSNAVSENLNEEMLRRDFGKSFAATLQQVKGVSAIETGATVAKPVIHGMHSQRILIVNNGVRQRGQQWGDDHAPELDMNTAGSIGVLKGADAVRYGSEALGGVVVLENRLLPYQRRQIKGTFSSLYGSNGRRYALSGFMDGAFPFLKDLAWRFQGTYINAGDRATPHYLLNNTGMREKDFSLALGYNKKKYGMDVFYSRFDTRLGVLYSSQMGDVDLLKERIALGRPVQVEPFTRKIDVPHQDVVHHLLRGSAFFTPGHWGTIRMQYAYQTDHRNEFHARRNNLSHIPSLSLDLVSIQADIGWKHHYATRWESEIGLHYASADNTNMPGTGVVPIIPNYVETNTGIFAIQKYTAEKWSAEAGVRFDHQYSNADGIDTYSRRYGSKRYFSNFTYNAGGKYHFSKHLNLVSNVGVAWRAPHAYELYSNGLDHAAGIYAVGDSSLLSERSAKWITSLNYASSHVQFSIDTYFQWVRNFIYDEPGKEYMTIISGVYPVFKYKQTHAFFRGVDADFNWNPIKNMQYNLMGSMIWVNESSTGRYLPYIPALRIMQSVRYTYPLENKKGETHIHFKHRYVAKQRRFDPQTDLIGVSPPAYHLFGLEAGYTLPMKNNRKVSVLAAVENLFNKEYKEYTNRFRYYAHDVGRDIRFSVVWQF